MVHLPLFSIFAFLACFARVNSSSLPLCASVPSVSGRSPWAKPDVPSRLGEIPFLIPNWRPWAPFVEPRWGSVIWVIGNPACAARHWAMEFNAFGVKARCWMLGVLFMDMTPLGNRGINPLLQLIMAIRPKFFIPNSLLAPLACFPLHFNWALIKEVSLLRSTNKTNSDFSSSVSTASSICSALS